jgi:hypothetical protein
MRTRHAGSGADIDSFLQTETLRYRDRLADLGHHEAALWRVARLAIGRTSPMNRTEAPLHTITGKRGLAIGRARLPLPPEEPSRSHPDR